MVSLIRMLKMYSLFDCSLSISLSTLFRNTSYRYLPCIRRHHFAPHYKKASFTVEATVVLPLFVSMMVFFMVFFRVMAIEHGIEVSLQEVLRKCAVYGNNNMEETLEKAVVIGMLESELLSREIPFGFIENGLFGINILESSVTENEIDVLAKYRVFIPLKIFGDNSIPIVKHCVVRRWVGYDPKEGLGEEERVYVTTYGQAYHFRVDCVYLSPSIHMVAAGDISSQRNESGGRYYACHRCGSNQNMGVLYITDYGDVFHTGVSCPALSRNIRQMEQERAVSLGYHPCNRCE